MRASVVLAIIVAACGGAEQTPTDAIPSDASLDASAAGPVSYVCEAREAGCPSADVVFQDADGVVVSIESLSGAVQTATAVMAPGGYVTIIETELRMMYTFSDVVPGDVLRMHKPLVGNGTFVDLTVPTTPGLDAYTFRHTCNSGGGSAYVEAAPGASSITFRDGDLDCARTDLVVSATNDPFRGATHQLVALDAPVSPTMTLAGRTSRWRTPPSPSRASRPAAKDGAASIS